MTDQPKMDATDAEIQTLFDSASPEARQHFLDLYRGWQQIPAEARVSWTPTKQIGPNNYTLPYPDYSPEFFAMSDALQQLGVYAPHNWSNRATDYRIDDVAAVSALEIPELARLLFRVQRAERFSEGTLARFIESGAFDALLAKVAASLS